MKDIKIVSIIVPIYNMGNSIKKLIDSLLNQTYPQIEIVLVDDGSTDDSFEICKKFSEKDERIKVVHEVNSGSGIARNFGIKNASGHYAYFPDADDEVTEKDALWNLVDKMESTASDLIVFGFEECINNRINYRKKYDNKLFGCDYVRQNYEMFINMYYPYGIQGAPWNKFFRLDIIKENNVQFPTLRRHQDEVFISRYVNYIDKVCFIDSIYYKYYSNDLKKEWDKYPRDYIDVVLELYKFRKDIILEWNPENIKVKNYIEDEYICNVIKSLELSFSKKQNFNPKTRMEWIRASVDKTKVLEKNISNAAQLRYQKMILGIIKSKSYDSLYLILMAKIFVEKNYYSLYNKMKKIIKE